MKILTSLFIITALGLSACGGSDDEPDQQSSSSAATSSINNSASNSSQSSANENSSSSTSSFAAGTYTQWQEIDIAFPGAEGFGKKASGGRGGDIYYVTNLSDNNEPGSLRYAISQTGPRVILFKVSGYIDLSSNLDIANGDVSILGQTAPGDGITLRGGSLRIRSGVENVVIRFIRSRLGAIENEADAFEGRYLNNIIVDHSSFSWAIDETTSFYANNNVTFQWSVISESLNDAGHGKGEHGYGSNWGGVNASFHHNVMAHHKSRAPRIDGILDKWSDHKDIPNVDGVADLRNNIFYNHATFPPYGAEGRSVQFINNYYKPGPATTADNVKNFIFLASGRRPLYDEDRLYTLSDYSAMAAAGTLDPKFLVNGSPAKPVGRVFVNGNYLEGNAEVTANNVLGVRYDDESLKDNIIQAEAFSVVQGEVTTQSAAEVFDWVLAGAGASLKRDDVDERVLYTVRHGIASVGNGIINRPEDVGGYPVLNSSAPPMDSDNDGMPDAWETANGLDPQDANDAWEIFQDLQQQYPEAKGWYTNAEVYWYSLVKHVPGAGFSNDPDEYDWSTSSSSSYQHSSFSSPASSASSSVSTSASSSSASVVGCPDTGEYFCDDFSGGLTNSWTQIAQAGNPIGANGGFAITNDGDAAYSSYTSGSTGGVLLLSDPAALGDVEGDDYYVEARLRITKIGGNKQLYLLARYQDEDNWYGAGLNVQSSPSGSRVAVDKNVGGVRGENFLPRHNLSLYPNTWYTVRFTLKGDALTVYLDGIPVITGSDSSLSGRGQVGLFTHNFSFDVDYIRVGDADDVPLQPSQLTFSPEATTWNAEANDDPYEVTVTAINPNGAADTFTVESDNTAVVNVSVVENVAMLTPLSEGTATITFTSGSDPSLTRTINAIIAPEFVQPVATYDLSAASAFPAAAETDTPVDTFLRLTFDSPPALGTGSIRIFNGNDDTLVDTIKLEGESDSIGVDPSRLRTVNTNPVRIDGNSVTINLHNNRLAYNTPYYVAITAGVFTGATLAGETFEGIGKTTGWQFTTRAAAPTENAVVVDDDGPADFRTLQGALNYVMDNIGKDDPASITLKNGVYEELLFLRDKNQLTIQGESREGVVIQYRNNDKLNPGAGGSGIAGGANGGRSVFLIEAVDLLTLENLTIKNTTLIGEGGQAETMYFNSGGRLVAKHINLISEQDTLLVKGYNWFYQSLIAGNVDFIWGGNNVSLFEESEIRSLDDSRGNGGGGYILQARTANITDKGFVFLNSRLTRGPGPLGHTIPDGETWLARSGGSSSYYDNIAFINTRIDSHIQSAGWNGSKTPNPAIASATAGWRQYNIMNLNGEPVDISAWTLGYTLTETEYLNEFADREKIFSAYNGGEGWNPQP